MPTLEENLRMWQDEKDWSRRGDEWSDAWGGPATQWYAGILPRIAAFVPAPTILEIAPGFGRWTAFLVELCDSLIGIDLSERCVDACRARFAGRPHTRFEAGDGRTLPSVDDHSIDFAFSVDSLVHVEADVMESYLAELARTLTPDGVAFVHHANLGTYTRRSRGRLPFYVRNDVWRGLSVSAPGVRDAASRVGLRCVGQELIGWDMPHLSDAFSIFARPGSRWDRPNRVVVNRDYVREMREAARRSRLYDPSGFGARAGSERPAVPRPASRRTTRRTLGTITRRLRIGANASFHWGRIEDAITRRTDPYRRVLEGRGPCPHCGGGLATAEGTVACTACRDEFIGFVGE